MRVLLFMILASNCVQNINCCLKGWDVTVAMRESTLNKAYLSTVTKYFRIVFPSFTHREKPNIPKGEPWGTKASIKLSAVTIKTLSLRAMKAESQVGKLEVSFKAGTCTVSKELVKPDGSSLGFRPSKKVYSFLDQIISFRVRVTSYKLNIKESNKLDRYKIKLTIVDDDAIIGNLMWKDLSVFDTDGVRKAITSLVKRNLAEGEKLNLGEFDLPKANPHQSSLIKDLFPKQVRFVFIYAPNGKSVFAALTSTKDFTPNPEAFHWKGNELLPDKYNSSVSINSHKFMGVLKVVIAKHMKISPNMLKPRSNCPGVLELRNRIVNYIENVNLESVYIESLKGDNQLEVKLKLRRNISPGIFVNILTTLRFRLTFNKKMKKFDVVNSYEDTNLEYIREPWVKFLEVASFGAGRLVTLLVEHIATQEINKRLDGAFSFNPKHGGLPTNVGGPLKVIFDNVHVSQVSFNSAGNLVFNFGIALNAIG